MPWDPRYRKEGAHGVTANAIDVVDRNRGVGPDHAGRHQPAERSGDPRALRQQVGVAVERERGVRSIDAAGVPQRVLVDARGSRARREVERVRERADDQHARGHRPRLGQDRRAAEGQSAGARSRSSSPRSRSRARISWRCTSCPIRSSWSSAWCRPTITTRSCAPSTKRYARNALVQLRRVREGTQHRRRPHAQPADDRPLADGEHGGHRRAPRDGKTYYVMTDAEAFREGVGRLLAEVQRIKAEGDYDAARALFDTYGVHFDPALRDEVVARVDRLQLPSYTGFVMPRLEPVTSDAGEITDVAISYPLDLTRADARILGGDTRAQRIMRTPSSANRAPRVALRPCARDSASRRPRRTAAQRDAGWRSSRPKIAARRRRAISPSIRAGLHSGDAQTARVAVRALGRLERPALAADIVPSLKHPLPEIRAEAANAIAQARQGWKKDTASGRPLRRPRRRPRSPRAWTSRRTPIVRAAICDTIGRLPYAADAGREPRRTRHSSRRAPRSRYGRSIASASRRASTSSTRQRTASRVRSVRRRVPLLGDLMTLRAEGEADERARRVAAPRRARNAASMRSVLAAAATDPDCAGAAARDARGVGGSTCRRARSADALTRGLADESPMVRLEALPESRARMTDDERARLLVGALKRSRHARRSGRARSACAVRRVRGRRRCARADGRRSVAGRFAARLASRRARARRARAAAPRARAAAALPQFTGSRVWQLRMYAARAAAHAQGSRCAREARARRGRQRCEAAVDGLRKSPATTPTRSTWPRCRAAAIRSCAPRRSRSTGRRGRDGVAGARRRAAAARSPKGTTTRTTRATRLRSARDARRAGQAPGSRRRGSRRDRSI